MEQFKCRLCLNTIEVCNSLYDKSYNGSSLADLLKLYTSLELADLNGYLSKVCGKCTTIILEFHNVVTLCKSSEDLLKSSINPSNELCNVDESSLSDLETEEIIQENNNVETNEVEGDEDLFMECNSLKYSCDSCGDCFLIKSGFQRHMLVKHDKLIQDEDYDFYSSKIKLKLPMFFPKGQKSLERSTVAKAKLKCKFCEETFDSNKDLTFHSKKHQSFICEICGTSFVRKSYLLEHKVTHQAVKRFKCEVCQKQFSHRSSFRVHKLTHTTSKQFVCDFCGQGFNQSKNLNVHIKAKHLKEKNFQCPECNLAFTVKSWLDKHFTRKHTTRNKTFACSECGMCYLEKGTLRRHFMDKHYVSAQTKHCCTLCDKKFVEKCSLKRHLEKKHNIIGVK